MSSIIKSYQVIEKNTVNENKKTNSIQKISEEIIKRAWEKHNQIINEAKIKADEIISEATKNADIIIEKTYKKSQMIIEESKQKGYEKGYKKGFEEGCLEAEKVIKQANEIKREYLQKKAEYIAQLEKDIIELVIRISEKVINKKLEDDKEAIISIVLKGLKNLLVSEKVIIRVSKDDYDIIELAKEKILAEASLIEDIEVKIDNSLEKGGCVIETERGCVDVSVKTQIESMKKTLREILNNENSE